VVSYVSKGRSVRNVKAFGEKLGSKDDSGVKVNILRGDNIGECEKRILYEYVSNSEQRPG